MGSMLSGSKPKAVATNTVVVPDFLNTQNQTLVSRASAASDKPFVPYTGERVAPFNQDALSYFSGVRGAQGKFAPLFQNASQSTLDLLARAAGPTSEQVRQLMNPFTQNVLDVSRRRVIEDFQGRESENRRREGIASSFGTSGIELARAQRQKDLLREISDMETRGMSDAFTQAMNQFNTGTSSLSDAIGRAMTTGVMGQEAEYRDLGELLSSGELQRGREQDLADFAYQEFEREQAFPYEQVNFLASILNPMTAAYRGGTTTETTKGGGGSTLGNALGIASSVASIARALPLSDERVKENIEEVGELDNGLPVYKFNYKGDPTTRIGLIAQDVEKDHPESVVEFGGIKAVDYDSATEPTRRKNKTLKLSSDKKVVDKFASGGLIGREREESREAKAKRYNPAMSLTNPFPSISGAGASSGSNDNGLASLLGSSGFKDLLSMFKGNEYGPSTVSLPGAGAFNDSYNAVINSGANPFSFAEGGVVKNPFLKLMKQFEAQKEDAANRKEYMRNVILGEDYADTSPLGKLGRQAHRFVSDIPPTVTETFSGLNADTYKLLGWLTAKPSEYREATGQPDPKAVETGTDEDAAMKAKIASMLGPKELPIKPNMPPKNDADFEKYREEMRAKNAAAVTGEALPLPVKEIGEIPNAKPLIEDAPIKDALPNMNVLEQMLNRSKTEATPEPQKEEGKVNMPLLLAGLAMLSTEGNFSDQLAAGVKAGLGQMDSEKKAKESATEQDRKKKREDLQDYMELLRLMAYMDQVKRTGVEKPVDPELAQLQKDRLRALIEATRAKAKKDASGDSPSEDAITLDKDFIDIFKELSGE